MFEDINDDEYSILCYLGSKRNDLMKTLFSFKFSNNFEYLMISAIPVKR